MCVGGGGGLKEGILQDARFPDFYGISVVLYLNPFSTGTGWTLYKVYGGFRISYGTG